MDIRISIATRQPLSGVAVREGGAPRPFEGWLDLLGVLSDLIPDSQEATAQGDPGSGGTGESEEGGAS